MKFNFHYGSLLAPVLFLLGAAAGDADNSQYDGNGAFVPQSDYREWVFLSSGVDMSYTEKPAMQGHSMFDNVFVERGAWVAFKESGHWPDKTVFAMENRGAATKGSINKRGQYQTENRMGVEYHIRDESRFKGGWAFFAADGDGPATLLPQSAACYSCHLAHGAVDTTFTQFYPTAKPIAVKAGSFHEN